VTEPFGYVAVPPSGVGYDSGGSPNPVDALHTLLEARCGCVNVDGRWVADYEKTGALC